MTLNLETLALRRAAEQDAAGAWRRADRGEWLVDAPPVCEACGESYRPSGRGRPARMDLCPTCCAKGYRSHRCPVCEKPVKTWDIGKPACSACRKAALLEAA